MNSPSSHKSYRPVTVLSLRVGYYIADLVDMNGLFIQRLLNIILHAVLVQMVARLYACLFKRSTCTSTYQHTLETTLVKVLFMLHPTHIESVVNIANRAHLLSLLFCLMACDLEMSAVLVGFVYLLGLLSCETAVFLFPAVCFTWVYIDFCKFDDNGDGDDGDGDDAKEEDAKDGDKKEDDKEDADRHADKEEQVGDLYKIKHCIQKRLPRLVLITIITFHYLYTRHRLDWIHIPPELIRPAENPFYTFDGMNRVWNYALVLSIHVVKSLGMGLVDLVGFSHEYGFDCVRRIESLQDGRLWIPVLLVVFVLYLLFECCQGRDNKRFNGKGFVLLLTFSAWMASLFPVSGFIRVGTFIADRIVTASTVPSAILWTRILSPHLRAAGSRKSSTVMKYSMLVLLSAFLWIKVQRRSAEWMAPKSLLESSLRACPRSAKSHLEMSKVYSSGLFDTPIDLDKTSHHLETAQEIDADFCDLHYQFALLYFKQNKFLEFEERVTLGVLCQFTMQGAHSLFQQYWSHVLNDPMQLANGAKERYTVQINIIQDAIQREKEMMSKKESGEDGEGIAIDIANEEL